MPERSEHTKTVVTRRTHMEFERHDLLKALRALGYQIPDDADMFVQVPGGGDWSNTNLDIERDTNLHVRWTTVEES